jgi:hypothetical protein
MSYYVVEEAAGVFVLSFDGFISSEVRGFPVPTGEFELRCTKGRRKSFELHPPNAPVVSRSEIVRFYDTEAEAKESER